MKKSSLIISTKEIILFLAVLAYYIPPGYAVPSLVHSIWLYYMLAVSILSFTINVYRMVKQKKRDYPFLMIFLFLSWCFVGTKLFSMDSVFNINNYIRNLGFVSLVDYNLSKKDVQKFLRPYICVGILMTVVHFISFLIYRDIPGGMRHGEYIIAGVNLGKATIQNYYFLSYDNNTIYFFLPVACALFYYTIYINTKAWKYLIAYDVLVLYMYISLNAATAMMAFAVLVFGEVYYVIFKQIRNAKRLFTYKMAVLFGLGTEILAFLLVGGEYALKIGNLFGKTAFFTGRGVIWTRSFMYISQNLLTGKGMQSALSNYSLIGQTHCHNLIIELLYASGIIGLALFLIFLYMSRPCGKVVDECIFSFAILAYFLAGSMDWLYENPLPYALFFFTYYLSKNDDGTNVIVPSMFHRKIKIKV